jgi:DNA-binding NtrC family response regulator
MVSVDKTLALHNRSCAARHRRCQLRVARLHDTPDAAATDAGRNQQLRAARHRAPKKHRVAFARTHRNRWYSQGVDDDALKSGTWITYQHGEATSISIRRCRIEVLSGPDEGLIREFDLPFIRIGGRRGTDLVLSDRKVSGLHLEIRLDEKGYRLRDLESTNGTYIGGIRINDAYVRPGTVFAIGKSELRFVALADSVQVPLSQDHQFHSLIGSSVPMRRLFATVERFAQSDATVLITGETGSGKELVADAIHRSSQRAKGPFVVVDCGAIPANLFENELFGHERGAFTNAVEAMAGAFERAHGGTLFLDEIGELPIEMQPKLLRAVQSRQVRRLGGSEMITCDVRLIAATNRDLAVEVNRGNFRDDLYYRLAVARVQVAALRERKEDIPLLIEHFLDELPGGRETEIPADFKQKAMEYYWPGNVRELRNAVERAVVLPRLPTEFTPLAQAGAHASGQEDDGWAAINIDIPFKAAKKQFVEEFDRRFMRALLERHYWNISAAARATGVDRMTIYKLLQRLKLERE